MTKLKKCFTRIKNSILTLLILLLAVYMAAQYFYPEETRNLIGYQPYVILTDSMVPTIPVYSLVVAKTLKPGEEPEENSIVSFHVDRFGEDLTFTHYFRKKELDATGEMRYFTQGETAPDYDGYVTRREDLIGTYVFHIPYAGKFFLFLKSPFALLELGLILIIMTIYTLLSNKLDEEEESEEETENEKETPEEQEEEKHLIQKV